MVKQDFDDSLYFLKRFLKGPRQVASVWPSSRYLTQEMFDSLSVADGDLIVEYGPGTGAFTGEILRLREQGVNVRYLGVEKDPGMYAFLSQRYPSLDFVLGDAADVLIHCESRGLPRARAVISGLPLIFFNWPVMRDIVRATGLVLERDGVFRTFSYVHSFPTRGARDLRELMREHFENFSISRPVLRNVPPAFALTGSAPASATSADQGARMSGSSDCRFARGFGE